MTEPNALISTIPRKKTPLAYASLMLAELCDRIEEQEDREGPIDAALIAAFEDTALSFADGVDRRIAFDTFIKGSIETARQAREQWNAQVQLLKLVHEKFKERTKAIVETTLAKDPELEFRGKLGKLAIQRNPPSLVLAFGDKVLTLDLIKFFGIDMEFVRVSYAVDTERVKGALRAGTEITWAALRSDATHLRFRK